ncbi:MAG: DUF3099 domain-containing protein [Dermatophilaceae bacterium]
MKLRQAPRPAVVHTVTTAPVSVADDQDMRVRRYLITMGIRTVCFFSALLVEGWLRWALVLGAVALPYVAVVLANCVGPRWGSQIGGLDTDDSPTLGSGDGIPAPVQVLHGTVQQH